jgi:AraC-like DNA-binding protein
MAFMAAARSSAPGPHAYLTPGVANIFQVLGVSAAIRQGVHPEIWDGTGWFALHRVPSVLDFELQHGVELERVKYNLRSMDQARRERRTVRGRYAGMSDLFVPIVMGDAVPAVLATGPFMTAWPSSAALLERWRGLTGRQGHPADPEFAYYVDATLSTLVLDGEQTRTFERFLSRFALLLAGEPDAKRLFAETNALRTKLEAARLVEHTWDMTRSLIDERTTRSWSSPQLREDLEALGLARVPDQALVGLVGSARAGAEPLDVLLRRYALQRACVDLARTAKSTICGRVGDHGVVFLSCGSGSARRRRDQLADLANRVDRSTGRRFGFALHFGTSGLAPGTPLCEHYRAALQGAELALSRGVRMAEPAVAATRTTFPLHELRQDLVKLALERPRELPARFDRYLEAVAVHSGYRVELAAGHLEAAFEHLADALLGSGALEHKAFVDASSELGQVAREARTVSDLFVAYRRAVANLCEAADRPTPARHGRGLDRALSHIHRHYAEPLRRTAVARLAGYAPDYFARLFKKREGMTFEAYVRRRRVERAKELLTNTELALKRVAQLAGLGTRHHFSRAFKRATGTTPLGWRRAVGRSGNRTTKKS